MAKLAAKWTTPTLTPTNSIQWNNDIEWTSVGISDNTYPGITTLRDTYSITDSLATSSYPDEFKLQVAELVRLLHEYGPKIRLLADVLGAMKVEEDDNNQ